MSEKTAPSEELATLRRDHVAGAAFIVAGVLLWAVSGDLPFGTLASPGAGMLPKLVIALMVGFAVILLVRAGDSPPLATLRWGDLPHAVRVVAVTAAGIALYTRLGFLADHGAAAVRPDVRHRAQARSSTRFSSAPASPASPTCSSTRC